MVFEGLKNYICNGNEYYMQIQDGILSVKVSLFLG